MAEVFFFSHIVLKLGNEGYLKGNASQSKPIDFPGVCQDARTNNWFRGVSNFQKYQSIVFTISRAMF